METDKLKIKTLFFFFNAMRELHTAVDSALDSLNDNGLSEQEKFDLLLAMLGHYGLSANLFMDQVCGPIETEEEEAEIGGPIQEYDYRSFPEERCELQLLNGLIGFNIPLN